jgi:hypothetical protein
MKRIVHTVQYVHFTVGNRRFETVQKPGTEERYTVGSYSCAGNVHVVFTFYNVKINVKFR